MMMMGWGGVGDVETLKKEREKRELIQTRTVTTSENTQLSTTGTKDLGLSIWCWLLQVGKQPAQARKTGQQQVTNTQQQNTGA